VKVNNVTGTVEHIGLRSTRIRTNEQTLVTVPNKQMVDGIVDNWSMRSGRRAEFKIELSNTSKTIHIEEFIVNIKTFLEEKKPLINKHAVFITDFNKASTTVTIEYFTIPIEIDAFLNIKQETAIFIKNTSEKHQLKMDVDYIVGLENSKTALGEVTQKALGPVKEAILPLQTAEAGNIKDRLRKFDIRVREYRQEFQGKCPYNVIDSSPAIIAKAYDTISEYYNKTGQLEDEARELNNLETLFDIQKSTYKQLKDCKNELYYLPYNLLIQE
jgi:hypothetical protein